MTIRQDMASATASFFATTGVQVTYKGNLIQALVSYDEAPGSISTNHGQADVVFIKVLKTDVPVPVKNDAVVIEQGGVIWKVQKKIGSTASAWKLHLESNRKAGIRTSL